MMQVVTEGRRFVTDTRDGHCYFGVVVGADLYLTLFVSDAARVSSTHVADSEKLVIGQWADPKWLDDVAACFQAAASFVRETMKEGDDDGDSGA